MAKTREHAEALREAKLDDLHKRLADAVAQLVPGEDWARAFAARFEAAVVLEHAPPESAANGPDGAGTDVILVQSAR